jgi:hypothetical protein
MDFQEFSAFEEKHNKIMEELQAETSGWDQTTTGDTMSKLYDHVSHLMFQIETLIEDNAGLEYDLFIARKERDAALWG